MELQGDADLLQLIIDRKYGGIGRIQDAWAERFIDTLDEVEIDTPDEIEKVPSKATLNRWRNGALPRTAEQLLRWADVLDLDPVALLNIPPSQFKLVAQRLASKFAFGKLTSGGLEYLGKLITPSPMWPPNDYVYPILKRNWHIQELEHDPTVQKDFMACVILEMPDWDGLSPRTFHFAYRRNIPELPFWTPYGTVIRHSASVRLYHSSGFERHASVNSNSEPTRVGTEFGSGPAFFKIASLRPFTARVGPDANLDEIVHFGTPT